MATPANDLDFDMGLALPWFTHEMDTPYVLVRVGGEHAKAWTDTLGVAVRRCYVTDSLLEERATELGVSKSEIVAARLPDAGSTMAGDFGEILVYFYQAAREQPLVAIGPKKWRLKQDRTKPAPYSDVVHFVLPNWPTPSPDDHLLCSEVKTKATNGNSKPIRSAIDDCAKDRTSRLARTLTWLRERALTEDLGDVGLAHLDRFINVDENPSFHKRFRAVAVVCSTLVDAEIPDAPTTEPADYTVVVIAVPDLKTTYTSVYRAARQSVAETAPQPRIGGAS